MIGAGKHLYMAALFATDLGIPVCTAIYEDSQPAGAVAYQYYRDLAYIGLEEVA